MSSVSQLPEDVRAVCRYFAFYITNGTPRFRALEGIDYRSSLLQFGSPLEQVFAIFTNVLDVQPDGSVTNTGEAMYPAVQYVCRYCDPSYIIEPPFEDWETELV
ncbi:DUF7677 family protein [Salinispora cortesiana]|uniref:DUF7677 family protein n=1 Tax=Salinispora cortesiana TaxID=1305843 RepID=UPI0009B7917A